ncbi:ATP-NAD kinase family protein [Homoserinimonas sp. OAct 916]|uniref:ATP-NAD kinase family protein n=1 Tax=Homoserinimonas sp. OAct 916 TaxID=2211450 RepID=UPI000DBEA810|nr:NAD(+)/NADH kinase [Homoserinimonas sp. OAct 916]
MDRVIGLLVNPVAGVGGPAGLKGSDGAAVQAAALARGATARAGERALRALEVIAAEHPGATVLTAAGSMGADAVAAAGLSARVVYTPTSPTSGSSEGIRIEAAGAEATRTETMGAHTGGTETTGTVTARPDTTCTKGMGIDVIGFSATGADTAGADTAEADTDGADAQGAGAARAEATPADSAGAHSVRPKASRVETTGADTTGAAAALVAAGAGLVLFVGGDGTARDVAAALAATQTPSVRDSSAPASPNRVEGHPQHPVPILGVPAGVKMYSGCFAVSPAAAGALAARWISDPTLPLAEREVLDVDEEQIREGRVDPKLYALVNVPFVVGRTQSRKSATAASETAAVGLAARGVIDAMRPGTLYLLGPGGTCREVAAQLGVPNTPLGVDAVQDGQIVKLDASEGELLELLSAHEGEAKAMVTVIGGQGFLLGRGNQQISARVLRALGPDPLRVVATESKITALAGRPLLVDTGDADLDRSLTGYIRVTTGVQSAVVYRVAATS